MGRAIPQPIPLAESRRILLRTFERWESIKVEIRMLRAMDHAEHPTSFDQTDRSVYIENGGTGSGIGGTDIGIGSSIDRRHLYRVQRDP